MLRIATLLLIAALFNTSAFAGGEIKEVCRDKLDKAGKVVVKNGKSVQDCKKIKVHKKLETSKDTTKK